MLKSTITDHQTNERIEGMIGNNFLLMSAYYYFSVVLPAFGCKVNEKPESFGDLHVSFISIGHSAVFQTEFQKQPVICLSVSTTKTYYRTTNVHPV